MADVIRVLLVDDQQLIRTGFSLVLMSEGGIEVVGEAGDGEQALEWLRSHGGEDGGCDVVLMDVRMPGMNGIDATKAIVERYPSVRVLVLTTFDLDEYAFAAVQAGAAGFLLKDARPTELVDAIHRVHSGDAVMAPSTTKRIVDRITAGEDGWSGAHGAAPEIAQVAAEPAEHGVNPVFAELTERELEVLRLIAEGLNNSEIGERLFLSQSTVKTHVGRIFSKLQLRDRVHAVILATHHNL